LNGTRYFLAEGRLELRGSEWLWTLALTLPKEESEPVSEGDFSLSAGELGWYASVAGGHYHEAIDEPSDALVIQAWLELSRLTEAENTEAWQAASADVQIATHTCQLRLTLRT
jgi:hypothetical protein